MGQEILYCYKCQTRLMGSEFEKGKAFKVGGQASCAVCVKDLLASKPEGAKVDVPLKASSSNRIPAAHSESSSGKFKPATARTAPTPEPPKSRNGLIVGAVIGVAVVILLIAMAMKSGSGPTVRRDPDPPAPIPVPPPGNRPPDPPPVPIPPATPTFAAELREIDEKMRTALANEEFRSVSDTLAEARKRRTSGDWLAEIDLRIPQIEIRARRSSLALREKAVEANRKGDAAEVKRLRDRIAAWGFPSVVEEFDKALAAPVAPPPPPPPPVTPVSAEPPLVVYDDALAPGWKNWSWNGVLDFAATSPVFEGKTSIAFTPHKEAAGIYLHFDQGLDPAQYPFVTFAAYVSEEFVGVGVTLYRDKKTNTSVPLPTLIPDFKVGEWKRYVVPVEKLNSLPDRITGFQVQVFKAGDHPLVYIDSIAFLRSASAGTPAPRPPATELDAYRARWSQAAAKASMRDYAGAQREIEDAVAALKEEATKAEAAADLELVKLAGLVPVEAAKAVEKWTKGQKVKLEVLNGSGGRDPVEGAVLTVDAVRVVVQRESGPLEVPSVEIAPSSLAEIFRARAERKTTDAKAAAAFLSFEGEGPAPAEKTLPKERPAAEIAARRTFWTAEAEFLSPRRRPAAVEKFTAFLAGEPASYVARLRPYVAARLEAAKDTVFLADDLTGAGTFLQQASAKLDVAWISSADSAAGKARENYVEAEFHVVAGAAYRAWIYTGACCLETFECLLQGSELTAPNPKNPKEPFSCEPGAESALAAKAPSITLKKWHAQHGGPKEPSRWEWIPVALPKFETAGPRKLRILTAQQGFSVGAIVVSAIRKETPKETEIKDLEKVRFGIRKSANTGPTGFILHEVWENIDGDTVDLLTKHPSYAGKPTLTNIRESFEGPKSFADRYGARIRGFVHPPVTGNYVFWLATDDNGELHLSLDDTPARKRLVCTSPSTGFRDWTRNPAQKSAPVTLMAGKRYYVEALQKEGAGDDHLSVGWTLPDGAEEKPIPGSRLSPWNATPQTPGPPGTVFYRGYNINGPPTLIDGRRWEGKGSKDLAYSGEGAFENQSVPLTPPTDDARAAMIRTSAFSSDGTAVKVYQLPAGSYLVYFYVWEDNLDQVYDIFLQGKEVLKGFHSGVGGHWDKLGPFPVTLTDPGTLDFKTSGGHANVSGVEIWKVGK